MTGDGRKIVKRPDGYHVLSEDGSKHLGGPYKSEKQAKKRLEQVEYFKNKGKNDMNISPERRFLPISECELRVIKTPAGGRKIIGRAAVFNKLSQDLGGFVEKLHPKAFAKVVKSADVRALRNHMPDMLLGRTKSGTLRLKATDEGLDYEIDAADHQIARDTIEMIERGDLDGSSFSFTVGAGDDEWDDATSPPTRTVNEVRDLFDVGPVTYPAYLDTSAGARMLGECRSFQAFCAWKVSQTGLVQCERDRTIQRVRLHKLRLGVSIFQGE